ncbi:MAG: ADP-ribosylglycohydrolase family protein [Bacteroidales bacterium]|nr:ADP-ribosylglycohydrolase family protein [Bacteroidales bacterium]
MNFFEDAVVAAVNHSGDSDSTGAITGNLMGAIHGYAATPEHYKQNLELHDVIIRMADELAKQD